MNYVLTIPNYLHDILVHTKHSNIENLYCNSFILKWDYANSKILIKHCKCNHQKIICFKGGRYLYLIKMKKTGKSF